MIEILCYALIIGCSYALGRMTRRKPAVRSGYPLLEQMFIENWSIRCAPTKALPKAWIHRP